ncbi:MAG: penicillin-binding transpeptidase domain-containing protein [Acidobacteriota bacterium]|nr:penicillin-binding transpeptidase domain-containing protein [Acidobacteriota bacterium]
MVRWLSILLMQLLFAATALPQADLAAAMRGAMQGRQGTAVVLDVSSGKVLAAHDLERAGRRLARPGSAIKPFVLATLADRGLLKDDAGVHCTRRLTIAGRKLNCGHPAVGAALGPVEALAYSCNTYFTTMGMKLTPEQLRDGLRNSGITSRTGLLPREAVGSVVLAQGRDEVALQSIGEEKVLVTPLGLLQGYLRLARERRAGAEGPHEAVFRGLEAATDYGMSRLAQPEPRYAWRVAGKTGTSMAAEGAWTHGWFAGYAPADHPQIVLIVYLENGAGPTDAAPVARQLFAAWSGQRK